MSKEQFLSLIRTLLTAFGAYLLGINFLGTEVNESVLQEIVGATVVLIATVWSIADKSSTIEMLQTGFMHVIKFLGGFLVASGKISGETSVNICGIIAIVIPIIYRWLSRKKTEQLANGNLNITNLNGGK